MTWLNGVLYNIPPDRKGLAEDVRALPAGTMAGNNDWKRTGYGGPSPPIGHRRYFQRLNALDTKFPDPSRLTRDKLDAAMRWDVMAEALPVGTYYEKK